MSDTNKVSPYSEAYAKWKENPERFWANAAEACFWYKKWDKVLDRRKSPFNRWFVGGETNTCYKCIDLHVESGFGDQTAIIYDSPVTDTVQTYTYKALQDEVALLAGMLAGLGVTKGDRVVIYMPMIPQTTFAMLACARIGAIHSVVFGGFASEELAKRIDDATPKVILSASYGVEPTRKVHYKPLLDEAVKQANHQPETCVIFQRDAHELTLIDGQDKDWATLLAKALAVPCVPLLATDPLYILYTSGTTGAPKGIVRDHGGHMVALKWSMKHVYGAEPADVYWAASDVGWVVGHSYIVYAPLLNRNTTVLYEGKPVGTPDAAAFWRLIEQHKVNTLFTAPTAFRVIKKEDPQAALLRAYDTSSLRSLFLAGERADPDTVQWAEKSLGVPVIDHWWQTETGWPQVSNFMGMGLLDGKVGSASKPSPGFDVQVVDSEGLPINAGETGALVIKLPLPPGCLTTLWRNEDRFLTSYLSEFPGFYATGDAGFIDEDGYVHVMSRLDDVINVAGHRLSTGSMEEVIADHPAVAECAVIGAKCEIKGQQPVGLAILNLGETITGSTLQAEVVAMMRKRIGPVASFRTLKIVQRLPKTRSGKILRGTLRKIVDGEDYVMPATIDDPHILDEIEVVLSA